MKIAAELWKPFLFVFVLTVNVKHCLFQKRNYANVHLQCQLVFINPVTFYVQTHPIDKELVKKTLGDHVAVSPVVTIEPRHRKFHQPIAITIPIPSSETGGRSRHVGAGSPTLRLLCSLVGEFGDCM